MLARRKSKKLITIFLILTMIFTANIPISYAEESGNAFPLKKVQNGETELSIEQVSVIDDTIPVYLAKSSEKVTDLKLYMPVVSGDDYSWYYYLGDYGQPNEMSPLDGYDEWADEDGTVFQQLCDEDYCWELDKTLYKQNKEIEATTIQSRLGEKLSLIHI